MYDPEAFLNAYIEAALWSSTDETTPEGGEPLDDNYTAADLTPETREAMRADCERFRDIAGALIDERGEAQAGHDFWLTRNGHGSGFWDGGWPVNGEALTALCGWRTEFPEVTLYVVETEVPLATRRIRDGLYPYERRVSRR